ncbi:MAG: hypothetical protein LBC70_10035 [Chitinispirillales bacterium]|jgi:hypothetical protein|nr:hypothetical protein [Chitinispirillales bacterium]
MDFVSMMLNPRAASAPVNLSKVVMDSSAQMTQMSEKMLKTGLEMKLAAGKEIGKGQLLDFVA